MKLKLIRKDFTDKSTIGELYVNDKFECFILEDVVRDTKIKGETAIPYGTYDVVITYSPRFGCHLPLLLNVPNFSGIRIHKGNTRKDTEGCLLPGASKGVDVVYQSAVAFNKLYPQLVEADKNKEKITIEVTKFVT